MTKQGKRRVDVITLGCSKNLVDSEFLIRQFEAGGFSVEHDAAEAKGEIVVINTCGFIGDAKEESIDTILDFAEAKKEGRINKLYVMGCLSERYFDQLGKELPEVDRFFGKFNWQELIADLGSAYRPDLVNERSLTTPGHYAYLKISEGCNRSCSYCAIPIITGKHKSKPIEDLVEEARLLASQGVKELQVIAQDLSYYGLDLYKKQMLAPLVEKLSQIEGIEWIRLHYAYPAAFPMDILEVMERNPKVCAYMDIALQHISDNMLKLMKRHVTKADTLSLVNAMREKVPGIHLRTTMITGHPGETEEDFAELLEFVKEMRFERLGVFPYSHEEDTYAWKNYKDNIPQEIKQARSDEIMALQRDISREINEAKVGTRMKVIIDRKEEDFFIGRSEFDSPEVDPEVLIPVSEVVKPGHFYEVEITAAEDYDLYATVVD
ncbi:30S ribosomal protein S12 methylthiotransferase RimO [Marinilabilia salmonicolor]|jgi:ribosomal protein S12 methylthiotransferase|uniref:Ribosomal protein uS12 methylthiotransferase RimO n=1 Tax=Marinilabilia salmonicolor TaxID=989 RepID=A0A2T0XM41_9BACT|nr:30S ribosomal protein S12 methylthiotransferase RimO [Marinilabilia salmonicolor]PRY99990.1 SSU ribosomal protein S12P methylthiotransferase [Marinilabilia salmonicolor]RCW38600.1 SSU ribosomal protein S12P methylthiotransferase [Marinilabilia salmonicolor]